MKALCTEISGLSACLLFDSELPEVGKYYTLEDATEGTGAQNRAFHALTQEYWRSGMHSYDCSSFSDFRDLIKKNNGEGFEKYLYAEIVEGKPKITKVAAWEDIPAHIVEDPDMRQMVYGKLKSWSKYTLNQRKNCIDNLIVEMTNAGVNSQKFQDILGGMSN